MEHLKLESQAISPLTFVLSMSLTHFLCILFNYSIEQCVCCALRGRQRKRKRKNKQTTKTKSFEFVVFHYFDFDLRSLLNALAQTHTHTVQEMCTLTTSVMLRIARIQQSLVFIWIYFSLFFFEFYFSLLWNFRMYCVKFWLASRVHAYMQIVHTHTHTHNAAIS